jgi:hypothetical protein
MWAHPVSLRLPGAVWLGTIGEVRLAGFQGGAANGERFSPLSYDRPFDARALKIKGILFIGCHSINLEPRAELHLVAGDFLSVSATTYKAPSSLTSVL